MGFIIFYLERKLFRSFIVLIILIFSINVLAHSGRTNSSGCHNNRKTGDYHCHNSGASRSSQYQKSNQNYNFNKVNSACCKVCRKGKACGNSCISRSYQCYQPKGCACDG